MTTPDERIRMLQEQLGSVNDELELEHEKEEATFQKRAPAGKAGSPVSWKATAAVIVLIILLSAILFFTRFSPTGLAVLDDGSNQTPADGSVVLEQQLEGGTLEDNTTALVNESAPIDESSNTSIELEPSANDTLGLDTNASPDIVVNDTNLTLPESNLTLNMSNATLNLTNQTINLTNETIGFTNATINITNVTLNLTNQTINLTNVTYNLTNATVNLANTTANITNLTNATQNITAGNMTLPTLTNLSDETGLPEETIQGRARVGEPVDWTRRVVVNKSGNVTVSIALPKGSTDIDVYELEEEIEENVSYPLFSPDKELWKKWEKRNIMLKNRLDRSRFGLHYVSRSRPREGPAVPAPESQTPAITGFASLTSSEGDGLLSRFLNWLDSLMGITGAAVIDADVIHLDRPADGQTVGRNLNFLYTADMDFDLCALHFDGFVVERDMLVLEGLNFFDMRGMAEGEHSWQVVCFNRREQYNSEVRKFIVSDEVYDETVNATLPDEDDDNVSAPPADGDYEYVELNITDDVTSPPKLYEITYRTPGPVKHEKVRSQYLKTVMISGDIHFQDVEAYTDIPWVPAWLVRLSHHVNGTSVPVENFTLIDSNNDSLIDSIEWDVPHLSNQTYDVNLSYRIVQVNITRAEKYTRNHTFEEDVTGVVERNDSNFTALNRKYLQVGFPEELAENDTVSVYAWSNKDAPLNLMDSYNGSVLSTITLAKNVWKLYNLTITGFNSSGSVFELTADNNVKYDFVTAFDKKLIIPKRIVPPSSNTSNISIVLTRDGSVDTSATPQFEPASVTVKSGAGNDSSPVAEFDVYFENSETDIDLSGLVAETDPVQKKSVIHMDEWPAEVSHNKTLYIPSSGRGSVYICPNASSISDVDESCADRFYVRLGVNTVNIGNESVNITVSEREVDGKMFYRVSGLTGTGGGESIDVLNVHSYPTLGGNWTVRFNTTGTANLTITPIEGTTWSEFLSDDLNTSDDLEFLELECGNASLKPSLRLLTSDGGVHDYSDLTGNDSIVVESLFVEDYSCNTTAYLTDKELYGGSHAILFRFGSANATAYNYVSQLECYLDTAGSDCDSGYTEVMHISSVFNAHAEFANQSDYGNYVCCKEVYGETLGTNCSHSKAEPILNLESLTNSHVEKVSQSNYAHELCLSPTDNYNISCSYDTSCTGDETCVASISDGDTNLQVGNCTGSQAYDTKICCDTQDDTPSQGGCVVPYDDYTVMQNVTLCSGTYYLVDDGDTGVIRIGVSNVNVTCNGTIFIGDGGGYAFYDEGYTNNYLKDCRIFNYSVGVNFYGNSTIINTTSSNSTRGFNLRSNSTLIDSEASYNIHYGAFSQGENILINNSNFTNNTRVGVYSYTPDQMQVLHSNFYHNGNGFVALRYMGQPNSIVVAYNTFYNQTGTDDLYWDRFYECGGPLSGVDLCKIKNSKIYNNTFIKNDPNGISLFGSDNITIANNTLTDGLRSAIDLNDTITGTATGFSENITIHNNIISNYSTGIYIGCAKGVVVTNNTIVNNTVGLNKTATCRSEMSDPSGDMIYYNNFSNNTVYHAATTIDPIHFNTTVGGYAHGNWWDDVASLDIYDTNNDGFANAGTDYPYNSTNGGQVSGNVTDWGPIVPARACTDEDGDGFGAEGTDNSDCTFTHAYDCNDDNASVLPPYDDMNISSDTWLCNGTYEIADLGVEGVLNIAPTGIELEGSSFEVGGTGYTDIIPDIGYDYEDDLWLTAWYEEEDTYYSTYYQIRDSDGSAVGSTDDISYGNADCIRPAVSYSDDYDLWGILVAVGGGSSYFNHLEYVNITGDSEGNSLPGIGGTFYTRSGLAYDSTMHWLSITHDLGGNIDSTLYNDTNAEHIDDASIESPQWNMSLDYNRYTAEWIYVVSSFGDPPFVWVDTVNNTGYIQEDPVNISNQDNASVNPDISCDTSDGDCLVVWEQNVGGGYGLDIVGIILNGSLQTVAGPFNISHVAGNDERMPRVDYVPHLDEWIVVWEDEGRSGTTGVDIYAQRIDRDGQIIGSTISEGFVVCNLTGDQTHPDLAHGNVSGKTLVVFQHNTNISGQFIKSMIPANIQGNDTLIVGDGQGYGVYGGLVHKTVIRGFTVSNYSTALYLGSSNSDNLIHNMTFANSTYGVYINNTDDDNYTNNTFYNNEYGVYIENSTGNLFYYNNFTGSTYYHAYSDTSGNLFNTTNGSDCGALCARGNYWDDIGSLNILDTNSDGFGDSGTDYPYNSTNGGNVSAYVTDYGPITSRQNSLPTISDVVLNSSFNTNLTTENLTVWYSASDSDGHNVKNVTAWYLDGQPITTLLLPFEATGGNESTWTKDYANSSNHATVTTADWNSTGGYDGQGAYEFDPDDGTSTDGITVPLSAFPGVNGTWMVWVKPKDMDSGDNRIFCSDHSGGGGAEFRTYSTAGNFRWITGNGTNTQNTYVDLAQDVWTHIAFTWEYDVTSGETTIKGYRNSTLQDTKTLIGTIQTPDISMWVGRWGATTLNATLDEFMLFNRTLSQDQVQLIYQGNYDTLHFNETEVGDVWTACVTPNDGIEFGDENCSNDLTIESSGLSSIQVDPLDAWAVNGTVKFECNASGQVELDYIELWHDYSGTWSSNGSVSVSGTYAEAEFNRSGMAEQFRKVTWACYACDAGECDFSENRTVTIDLTAPTLTYEIPSSPADSRNSSHYDWLMTNLTEFDVHNGSAFIDFNRSLIIWLRMENNTDDSSSYGNDGTPTGDPETWTGARGKGYKYDGSTDYISVPYDSSFDTMQDGFTWMVWFKGDTQVNTYPRLLDLADTTVRVDGPSSDFRAWASNGTDRCGYIFADDGTLGNPDDVWHHVAYVYNASGSGHFYLYIDGVLNDDTAKSCTGDIDTSGSFSVSDGNYYKGLVDEAMVFNRPLSAAEVNASYQAHLVDLYRNFTGLASNTTYNYTAYAVDMAGNLYQTSYRDYSVNSPSSTTITEINSSGGTNHTSENLTVYYSSSDPDSDALTNITDWRLDSHSITVLNMPFDTRRTAKLDMLEVKDYSSFSNNGTHNFSGQLIDNGDAETGSTSGWSGWDGVNDTEYHDGSYSFEVTGPSTVLASGLIPVDKTKEYNISGWFRSNGTGGDSRIYAGFRPYDKDQNLIYTYHVNVEDGTQTELYEDVSASDDIMKVVDGTGWIVLSHGRAAFNIDDSGEYRDLPNRNVSNAGITEVTDMGDYWRINFSTTVGVDAPKGTKVRMHRSGGWMYTLASSEYIPDAWTHYSGTVSGELKKDSSSVTWWPGTEYAKILIYANYAQDNTYKLFVDDLELHSTPATYTGATWTPDGYGGGAYQFDGEDDYIITGVDGNDFDTNHGRSYTLEALVKVAEASCDTYTPIFGRSGTGSWSNWLFGGFTCYSGNVGFSPGYNGSSYNVMGTGFTQDKWHHLVGVCDNETHTTRFYVDNVEVGSRTGLVCVDYSNSYLSNFYTVGYAGLYDSNSGMQAYFNGSIDNIRIYNRSLTPEQVSLLYNNVTDTIHWNETEGGDVWKACITPNDGLEDGQTVCSDNLDVSGDTSLQAVKFNVSDFSFGSDTYVEEVIVNFNTTGEQTNLTLMTSMNIVKLTRGGSSAVWTRIKVDGTEVLEEKLRTVDSTRDEGTTGTKPVSFNVTAGEHNITLEFKRTGTGAIGVNDIDMNLGQLRTTLNNTVRGQIVNDTFTHSSAGFVPAFNWSVNKTSECPTFMVVKQTLESTGVADVDYYFENLQDGHTSPYWSRYMSGSSDVGSVSGIFIESDDDGTHNHTIQSRTSAGTITSNFTLMDFDMKDFDDNIINNFHTSNSSTNLTDYLDLGAGTHLLASRTVTVQEGNGYFLTMSSSFTSPAGFQTPTYYINATGVPESSCYSKKERYLSSSSDIGNAFIYMICSDLTPGNSYTFNLWVDVQAGETLRHKDESFNGFEVTSFDISQSNVAPNIADIVLNSSFGTNYTDENITANITAGDADGDHIKNITTWYVNGTSTLMLNMPFEAGSNSTWTKDYSGTGNDGTVLNAQWNPTGGVDGRGAYEFDGESTSISVTPPNPTEEVTVMAWVKRAGTTPNTWHIIFMQGTQIELDIGNSGDMRTGITTTTNPRVVFNSGSGIDIGEWHHVAMTYDNVSIKSYLDGVYVDERAQNGTISTGSASNIGMYGSSYYFNGTIDEFMMFDRALSEEQIELIYLNKTHIIHSNDTTKHENWSVCVNPTDGTEFGEEFCSEGLIVRNSAPTAPTSIEPVSGVYGGDKYLVPVNCSGATDADGDDLDYNIQHNRTGSWEDVVVGDEDGYYDWDVSLFPTTTDVGFRCNATDGEVNTSYYAGTGTITIDNDPPLPEPAQIFGLPSPQSDQINVTAATATDVYSEPSEYYFNNTKNGNESGWISDNHWLDTGLSKGVVYCYTVRYRDDLNNTGTISSESCNTTQNAGPSLTSLVLNATDHPENTSDANLTAWPQGVSDADGDAVKFYYNWYRNDTPITVLNLLMSQDAFLSPDNETVYDISGYGNDGTMGASGYADSAEPVYNSTAGYDGFGAYHFNGTAYMVVAEDTTLDVETLTLNMWARPETLTNGDYLINYGDLGATSGWGWNVRYASSQLQAWVYNSTNDYELLTSTNIGVGDWNMITLTYNGTHSLLYINATLQDTSTEEIDQILYGSGRDLAIGSNYAGGGADAYIGDILVYNISLTPEQIESMYNSGTGRYNLTVSQETSVGEWWNVSATPVDQYGADGGAVWSDNVTILSPNTPPIVENVTLNSTFNTNYTTENLTVYWDAADVDGDNITNITNWYLDGTSIAVLNMPFEATGGNESTWTKDYSDNSLHATVNGAEWNSTGGYDGWGEYHFERSENDYIEVEGYDITDLGMREHFSVEAWFRKLDSSSGWTNTYLVAAWTSGAGTSNEWTISLSDDGNDDEAAFSVQIDDIKYEAPSPSSDELVLGNWYHVVGTYDNETVSLYLNGTLVASTPAGGPVDDNNKRLLIGRNDFQTSYDTTMDVSLVRIWNRSLTPEQIELLYQNRTDIIHFNETSVGDVWEACVTPNDGTDDGEENCSNTLEIRSSAIETLQVDPLNSWILNDTIKFECNASSAIDLESGALWHNYSGSWAQAGTTSLSGTSAEYEFNLSGFSTEKTFDWACYACDGGECDYSSNRTITIDLTRPGIDYEMPTPADNVRNSTFFDWAYVNVSTSDVSNRSALVDFNRSLVGWWRFENSTDDSSTYGNDGSLTNGPELWTGARGKSYMLDGNDDHISIPHDESLNLAMGATTTFTIAAWIKPDAWVNYGAIAKADGGSWSHTTNGLWVYAGGFRCDMGDGNISHSNDPGSYILTAAYQPPLNEWYHVVCVGDGTNLRMYVNGEQRGGDVAISGITYNRVNVTAPVTIGRRSTSSSGAISGEVDEVQLFSRPLSEQEINASYHNGLYRYQHNFTGLAEGQTYNFTSFVVDMAGNLNQTPYRNYSVNWLPNVSNMVITGDGDGNFTDENLTVTYTSDDGDSDTVKNITTWHLDGLPVSVVNMPFEAIGSQNHSSWAKDYTNRRNHGSVNGPVWNSTGGWDGKGDYNFQGLTENVISIPQEDLNYTSQDFSISIWAYPHSTDTNHRVWSKGNYYTSGYELLLSASNSLTLRVYNGTSQSTSTSSGTVPDGKWSHIVVVRHGNTASIFVNGTNVTASNQPFGDPEPFDQPFQIGRYQSSPTYTFNGTLDDFMAFNRSLSTEQIKALYNGNLDLLVSDETSVGDVWQACVTPNDGLEDGTEVCSASLTVQSSAIEALQVDPLNSWILNDTIKFECNSTSAMSLTSGELWHNYSGSWAQAGTTSLSGTSAEYEFNISGFDSERTFDWACYACDAGECDFSDNRTATIDLTKPGIDYEMPTPANNVRNSTFFDWAFVNVSTSDASNMSAFIDWDRSLVGWWRFENNTDDSSTYGNDGTLTNGPELWTGARGKAYMLDGSNEAITLPASMESFEEGSFTINIWFNQRDLGSYGSYMGGFIGRGYLGSVYQGWSFGLSGSRQLIFATSNETASSTMNLVGTTNANLNEWHHSALTYDDNTGIATIYLDGQYEDSDTIYGNFTANWTNVYRAGWMYWGGNRYLNGSIDELTIHKRVLSGEEINATYRNQLHRLRANLTGLTEGQTYNYTAYTVDMAGNLNQTGYRNYSVNYLPNVSNMVLNATSVNNYTTDNITVWYDTDDGDDDIVKNITRWLVNGTSLMRIYLPFESGQLMDMSYDTRDYSGNDININSLNATWNSSAGFDSRGAYQFNGEDQNVEVEDWGDHRGTTTMAWFKPESRGEGSYGTIFNKGSSGHRLFISDSDTNLVYRFSNGTTQNLALTNCFTMGEWNHVAVTVDGDNVSGYCNGDYKDSLVAPNIDPNTLDMYIGGRGDDRWFNGTIDEFIIFNRSLSAEQIKAIYENSTDIIVSQELHDGDIWQACVTPNDGLEDGSEQCSEDIAVALYTECMVISEAGSYTLAANAAGAPKSVSYQQGVSKACIKIEASNVVFDCDGHTIINDGTEDAAGIMISSPGEDYSSITIRDCPQVNGYERGIFLNDPSDSSVLNSTVVNTSLYAFLVQGGSGNNITDSLAANNSGFGFVIGKDSSEALLKDVRTYSNNFDLFVNNTEGAGSYQANITNITFLNPVGGSVNSSQLTIADTMEIGDRYTINWTTNRSNIPTDLTDFESHWVNISVYDFGGGSIDDMKWVWDDSESSDYFEHRLEWWSYDGSMGWQLLNSTPDTVNNELTVEDIIPYTDHGLVENKSNKKPAIGNVILNATDDPLNRTTANLTSWTINVQDDDDDDVKLFYNWYLNGTSITVLNLLMSYDAQKSADKETILDISGFLNNATLGSPGSGGSDEPKFDKKGVYKGFAAYQFDGSDDYLNVSDDPTVDFDDNSFTIEMWVRSDEASNPSSNEGLIYKRSPGYNIYFNSAGRVNFYYHNSSTVRQGTYTSDIYDDAWHHIAVVRSVEDDSIDLYVDGQWRIGDAGIASGMSNNDDLIIGSQSVGSGQYFDGYIADVVIYNLSLTADQIRNDYDAGVGRHNFTVSNETSKDDEWNVSVTPVDDRGEVGDTKHSDNVTIENTPPTAPALYMPVDGNTSIMTRRPELDWNASTDVDGDTLTYRLNITHEVCGSEIVYTGISDTNKTVEEDLHTSDEDACWYNWTVEAYDGEDYGPLSSRWGFKIMPIIILNLVNNTVDFGDMVSLDEDNTTDDSPFPFVLQNDGTVIADIVNSTADTDLWVREPSPTDYFRLKVGDNETGSINLSGSATSWTQVSLANITVIDSLNYSDASDSARIDLYIKVPKTEPPGVKSVNMTFYGAQT